MIHDVNYFLNPIRNFLIKSSAEGPGWTGGIYYSYYGNISRGGMQNKQMITLSAV